MLTRKFKDREKCGQESASLSVPGKSSINIHTSDIPTLLKDKLVENKSLKMDAWQHDFDALDIIGSNALPS